MVPESPITAQVRRGIILFGAILAIGTSGYQMLGDFGFLDALYMTVITVFTIGYGDAGIDSMGEKIFTMLLIVLGSTAGLYIVGGLIRTLAEGEINRAIGNLMNTRNIGNLQNHTIICGYGRIGQMLARELSEQGVEFVVIDQNESRINMAQSEGFLTISGSAESDEALMKAGVERAAVLATVLPEDSVNVFITLTARNLNPNVKIIARGEQPTTEKKLRQAGADEVVLPTSIGASRIAQSITRPTIMELVGDSQRKALLSQELAALGVELDELVIAENDEYFGRSIGEFEQKAEANFVVLAVKRADGSIVQHPGHEFILEPGDSIIVIGNGENLPSKIRSHVSTKSLV